MDAFISAIEWPRIPAWCLKYGYAVVDAETEKDAIELTENMDDSEFDWSDFDDAQVVDDDVNFE